MINAYASNHGWLFEDLKGHLGAAADRLNVSTIVSDFPVGADAWICLRTSEASLSPDPSRTVVQIHDLFADEYGPGGDRWCVSGCGAVSLTHPAQREILDQAGILADQRVLVLPIGAPRAFRPFPRQHGPFAVGWVGRPARYRGLDLKRLDLALEVLHAVAARPLVILVGHGLGAFAGQVERAGLRVALYDRPPLRHSDYPGFFSRMDALLITSSTEAGPLCLFEALSCGVPVVSTPVGWAPYMIQAGANGFLFDDAASGARALDRIADGGVALSSRELISRTQPFELETWAEAQILLARSLASSPR